MKKTLTIILATIFIFGFWFWVNTPIFYKYSKNVEVYSLNNSSNARIDFCISLQYKFKFFKVGESCTIEKKDFCLREFIDYYNAKVIFTENTAFGESFYMYSNKIPYGKKINGKIINLHLLINGRQIVMGTPIIYGSY
jgi:hypothetical protein